MPQENKISVGKKKEYKMMHPIVVINNDECIMVYDEPIIRNTNIVVRYILAPLYKFDEQEGCALKKFLLLSNTTSLAWHSDVKVQNWYWAHTDDYDFTRDQNAVILQNIQLVYKKLDLKIDNRHVYELIENRLDVKKEENNNIENKKIFLPSLLNCINKVKVGI